MPVVQFEKLLERKILSHKERLKVITREALDAEGVKAAAVALTIIKECEQFAKLGKYEMRFDISRISELIAQELERHGFRVTTELAKGYNHKQWVVSWE